MRKFGLIGYPLGHSFSKKYFTDKFAREQISDCTYDNYPLEDIQLFPDFLKSEPDITGLNVTIPYKSEIIRFLDAIDPEAQDIGAVNVLKISKIRGRAVVSGYNSDVTGIRNSLLPYVKTRLEKALVLGTGGSSKSVCYVLKKLGVNFTLISRNPKTGAITYSDIDKGLIDSIDLIVNTTPLGMFPNIKTRPAIDYKMLSEKHILFDLVYNPEMTEFLKKGMEQGCRIITGINMLHSQAERAWEIWNENI